MLWALLSTYRHRTTLRAEGKRPAARPRFDLARWIWFRPLTRIASLLALRDGYPTIDLAWAAALRAVDEYGSAKEARKAIRAGRPVPSPEPPTDNEARSETSSQRDDVSETTDWRDAELDPVHPDDIERDGIERDGIERDAPCPASPSGTPTDAELSGWDVDSTGAPAIVRADVLAAVSSPVDDRGPVEPTHDVGSDGDGDGGRDDPAEQTPDDRTDVHRPRQVADGAMRARMEAFARASLAAGDRITGADLDRRFGTRDYGRKILREILSATGRSPAARPKKVLTPTGADRDNAAA